MEVSYKLLVCGLTALVGLLMQVIIFTSPGWLTVYIPVVKNDIQPKDFLIIDRVPTEPPIVDPGFGQDDISVDENNAAERTDDSRIRRKRSSDEKDHEDSSSSESSSEEVDRRHHRHHRHHHPHGPHISMKLALWYVVTCSHVPENEKCTCQTTSYYKVPNIAKEFPKETSSLDVLATNIALFSDKAMFEFRVEVTAALIATFCGLVATILYSRGGAKGRLIAISSFLSFLLACVMMFLLVSKVTTTLLLARKYIERNPDMARLGTEFSMPWCLVVALASAVVMAISSFGMLLILSRGHNPKDFPMPYQVEETGKYSQFVNDSREEKKDADC